MVFYFRTIIGSFFQLCMDRLPLGLDVIKGRSFCFRCFHPLQWKDLIPVMSFILLKGRCRYVNVVFLYVILYLKY